MASTNSNILGETPVQASASSIAPIFNEEYYETLSPREKFEYAYDFFKDREATTRRMTELSEKEQNEYATVWLAYLAMGELWNEKNETEGIKFFQKAIYQNHSFTAAVELGWHYWSDARFSDALKYADLAVEFAEEKDINARDAYELIGHIKSAKKKSRQHTNNQRV